MKKIFTTKISLQSSNPTFSYPIIRLPRDLKELAGRIVNVYQTEIDGVPSLVVSQLDKLDKSCPIEAKTAIDQRLSALESQIAELKSLILQKESEADVYKEKKGRGRDSNPRRGLHRAIGLPGYPTSARYITCDSPVRIRTAVAGFLLSVVNVKDHVNPKARMIDHYTTGLRPRVRVINT